MSGFGASLGNPAPLGLAAFGTCTFYLMTVDMGWTSSGFEDNVTAYAFYYGGVCQLLVGIAELIKGSSFSFLVFGTYGAFWMGFSELHFLTRDTTSEMGTEPDSIGKTMFYLQWTVLTTFFTFVAQRKNRGLVILLGLLTITFALLTISTGTTIKNSNAGLIIKRIAGYFGFVTALMAYYMAFAEIINEEWGRHVLPGLKPLVSIKTVSLSSYDQDEFVLKHMTYDSKSNTLMLSLRGIQILSSDDVKFLCNTIERAILSWTSSDESDKSATDKANKVHVIVDYHDAVIANDVEQEYKQSVLALQKKYYLSVTRFSVSSFGVDTNNGDFISAVKLG